MSGRRRPEDPGAEGREGADTRPGGDISGDTEGVRALRAEPEPAWADAIRRGRRSRAERLRTVFATFDDEEPVAGAPTDDAPPGERRRS